MEGQWPAPAWLRCRSSAWRTHSMWPACLARAAPAGAGLCGGDPFQRLRFTARGLGVLDSLSVERALGAAVERPALEGNESLGWRPAATAGRADSGLPWPRPVVGSSRTHRLLIGLKHAVHGRPGDAERLRDRSDGVLAALADPDDELTATAAMRNRLEGAAVALETVAGGRAAVAAG